MDELAGVQAVYGACEKFAGMGCVTIMPKGCGG